MSKHNDVFSVIVSVVGSAFSVAVAFLGKYAAALAGLSAIITILYTIQKWISHRRNKNAKRNN